MRGFYFTIISSDRIIFYLNILRRAVDQVILKRSSFKPSLNFSACLTAGFVGLFSASCSYHISKTSGADLKNASFSDQTFVDSQTIQKSVLGSCVRCHSGTTPPLLNSIDGIKGSVLKVQAQTDSGLMPPTSSGYSPLSDCQKQILAIWILDGMPNSSVKKVNSLSKCGDTTKTPDPVNIPILEMPLNFQTLASKILQPRCLHCHNAQSSDLVASGILLFPYSQLLDRKNLLGPDSAHSKFFNLVSRTDEDRMPPPEDSTPLAADDQEFIKRWLDAGHPE
jgi:hypothetical protein